MLILALNPLKSYQPSFSAYRKIPVIDEMKMPKDAFEITEVGKSITLLVKKIIQISTQTIIKIKEEEKPIQKVKIAEIGSSRVFGQINNFYEKNCKKLSKDEEGLFGSLKHEMFNTVKLFGNECEIIIHFNKPIPENFDKKAEKVFREAKEIMKRYEIFFDKGMFKDNFTTAEIFNFSLESINHQIRNKNINFSIEGLDILEDPRIKSKIKNISTYTVFSNILMNSAKYAKVKGGKIKVEFALDKNLEGHSLDKDKLDRHYLYFSVEDNGRGILPDEIDDILKGNRAERIVKLGIPGTGYGLKRIRKILKNLVDITSANPNNKDFPGAKISCLIPVEYQF